MIYLPLREWRCQAVSANGSALPGRWRWWATGIVLDAPSSGLDRESERLVFEGLRNLLEGRTTFVIAHQLATIRNADYILVLDQGRIVGRGTHDQLLTLNGLYARRQRGESATGSRALNS